MKRFILAAVLLAGMGIAHAEDDGNAWWVSGTSEGYYGGGFSWKAWGGEIGFKLASEYLDDDHNVTDWPDFQTDWYPEVTWSGPKDHTNGLYLAVQRYFRRDKRFVPFVGGSLTIDQTSIYYEGSGVKAICHDGWVSNSYYDSGTCSSHGGVGAWVTKRDGPQRAAIVVDERWSVEPGAQAGLRIKLTPKRGFHLQAAYDTNQGAIIGLGGTF